MSPDGVIKSCSEVGFVTTLTEGTGLFMPPGFIYLELAVGREAVHGLRWSLS